MDRIVRARRGEGVKTVQNTMGLVESGRDGVGWEEKHLLACDTWNVLGREARVTFLRVRVVKMSMRGTFLESEDCEDEHG